MAADSLLRLLAPDRPMERLDKLAYLLSCITQVYTQWAKAKGLNYTTFAILYSGYMQEACTQKDICDIWNLSKQAVSTQCNELMDQGIISLVQNDRNRRQKILTLTEKGQAYAGPLIEEIRAAELAALESLGKDLSLQLVIGAERFYTAFAKNVSRTVR